MNNLNNITQDWTHADQFLNDKIDKNKDSIKHDFDIVEKNVEVLNGVAEGQFVTDSTARSIKVVPEDAFKGIVSMIGGKTVKQDDVLLNAPVKKVVLEGKNLFDGKFKKGSNTSQILTTGGNYTNVDFNRDSYDTLGNVYATFGGYFKAGTYTFSYSNNGWFTVNRIAIAGTSCINAMNMIRYSYTWTQNVDGYTYFTIEGDTSATSGTDTAFTVTPNIQIERGTVATSYVPYNPHKTTLLLDKIVDKLPDYGASVSDNLYNYVDFEEMVYHHKVGSIDMGSLTWRTSSNDCWYSDLDVTGKSEMYYDAISSCYEHIRTTTASMTDKTFCVRSTSSAPQYRNIFIKDSRITSAATAQSILKGQIMNFEFTTEELIPLTDLLLPFKVEAGGTVTFENEHNLDVPNSVIYEKEMK